MPNRLLWARGELAWGDDVVGVVRVTGLAVVRLPAGWSLCLNGEWAEDRRRLLGTGGASAAVSNACFRECCDSGRDTEIRRWKGKMAGDMGRCCTLAFSPCSGASKPFNTPCPKTPPFIPAERETDETNSCGGILHFRMQNVSRSAPSFSRAPPPLGPPDGFCFRGRMGSGH